MQNNKRNNFRGYNNNYKNPRFMKNNNPRNFVKKTNNREQFQKEKQFRIKVKNFPKSIEMREILELFGKCGQILKVNFYWTHETNLSCECIIKFKMEESLDIAMNEFNEIKIDNNELKIEKLP